jgi:hypothetical protein
MLNSFLYEVVTDLCSTLLGKTRVVKRFRVGPEHAPPSEGYESSDKGAQTQVFVRRVLVVVIVV